MSKSLQLYRKLFSVINDLPVRPIQKKLRHNIRQVFDLYKSPQSCTELSSLHRDAEAAIQVLLWFRSLPEVQEIASTVLDYWVMLQNIIRLADSILNVA